MKKKSNTARDTNVRQQSKAPSFKSFRSALTGEPITKSITYQGYFYNESDKKKVSRQNIPFLSDQFTNNVLDYLTENPDATVAQILEEVTDPIHYTKFKKPVMGLGDGRTYDSETFKNLGETSPYNRLPQPAAIIHPLAHAMTNLDAKKQNLQARIALNLKNLGLVDQRPIIITKTKTSLPLVNKLLANKISLAMALLAVMNLRNMSTSTPYLQIYCLYSSIVLITSPNMLIHSATQRNNLTVSEICPVFTPQRKQMLNYFNDLALLSKILLTYSSKSTYPHFHRQRIIVKLSDIIIMMRINRYHYKFSNTQLSAAQLKNNFNEIIQHIKTKRPYILTNCKRLLVMIMLLSAVAEPILFNYYFAASDLPLSTFQRYANPLQRIIAPAHIICESACNLQTAVTVLPTILKEKKPFFHRFNLEFLIAFLICLSGVFFTKNPEISLLLFTATVNAYCRDKFVYSTVTNNSVILLKPLTKDKDEVKATEPNVATLSLTH